MFYFVSCLIGFSVLLGICLSLFFVDPHVLLSEGKSEGSRKAKIFEDFLKTEGLFHKGKLTRQEWLEKKKSFLEDYKGLSL